MPNPGSPEAMRRNPSAMPAMPKGTMFGMLAVMAIMMVVMFWRMEIGHALNYGLHVIDFNGQYPVLTLVTAGLIMITLSTVIRSLMMDSISQARNQKVQSDFNKEMRQAKLENNLFKLKKLQEEQPKIMAKTMESSTNMMKIMPLTMIAVIPIYAWVFYFINETVVNLPNADEILTVWMPWGTIHLNELLMGFLPLWIIVYTMISLPIGQLENRIVRYFLLKRRLSDIDNGIVRPPKKKKDILGMLFGRSKKI
jgi:uncharacterized membrane protein (DUF106 family)